MSRFGPGKKEETIFKVISNHLYQLLYICGIHLSLKGNENQIQKFHHLSPIYPIIVFKQ